MKSEDIVNIALRVYQEHDKSFLGMYKESDGNKKIWIPKSIIGNLEYVSKALMAHKKTGAITLKIGVEVPVWYCRKELGMFISS